MAPMIPLNHLRYRGFMSYCMFTWCVHEESVRKGSARIVQYFFIAGEIAASECVRASRFEMSSVRYVLEQVSIKLTPDPCSSLGRQDGV